MDVSIIIPLYKGKKYLRRLLDMMDKNITFQELYRECALELIFVNDYPEEQIFLLNEEHVFSIRLEGHEMNKGIHAARVTGLKMSKAEYVIFLDQDDLVRENWLYSQWKKITEMQGEFCICNGWISRFRVIFNKQISEDQINSIHYHLSVGNPIVSPGQVIMRKSSVPEEWSLKIIKKNGADDFFLWLLILKRKKFIFNQDYLYYHTPDRNNNSVTSEQMKESVEEMQGIMKDILNVEEKELLTAQIERWGCAANSYSSKFQTMFFQLLLWMRLKQRNIEIDGFIKKHNYQKLAIYGMGYLGECLLGELESKKIKVDFAIDRDAKDFKNNLTVYRVEDNLPETDIVIITVVGETQSIVKELKEKIKGAIVCLMDILMELDIDDKENKYQQ